MDELLHLIPNVGFPIAITIYLLVRFDGIMKSVVLTQQEMILSIKKLCDKINNK